jgi:hypothetical protein
VTLGRTPAQADLLRSTANFCEGRVDPGSIYGVLHRECFDLFPDEMFADLFTDVGRRSVPPMIVAVVMVLQRLEGLSDREAVDRFAFDARWKYAAGGLDFDYPGFVHTVLVDMRARLARSERPDRIFASVLAVPGGELAGVDEQHAGVVAALFEAGQVLALRCGELVGDVPPRRDGARRRGSVHAQTVPARWPESLVLHKDWVMYRGCAMHNRAAVFGAREWNRLR